MSPKAATLTQVGKSLQQQSQIDQLTRTKTMAKKITTRNGFLIPKDIAALFGQAPTLKTEDDEIY